MIGLKTRFKEKKKGENSPTWPLDKVESAGVDRVVPAQELHLKYYGLQGDTVHLGCAVGLKLVIV